MPDYSDRSPTARFSGLADLYSKSRPSYPPEAIDYIIAKAKLTQRAVVADIGCGTGISSVLFAQRGVNVLGIEPNADMRSKAQEQLPEELSNLLSYRSGTGEATGLPDQSVDLVVCAQSFHWLDSQKALQEFCRILKRGGWTALMWNERDDSDAFTSRYSEIVRTAPETQSVELHRQKVGQALLDSPLYDQKELLTFKNFQVHDEDGLVGRAFSASYAPREETAAKRFDADLRKAFREYAEDGKVMLRYETSIYLAQPLTSGDNSV